MSIEHDDQGSRALVVRDPERYRVALGIARQLNAEFKPGCALKVFNALARPDVLSVAVTVGAVGAVAAVGVGIVRALRLAGHTERQSLQKQPLPDNPSSRQLMVISETM